MYEGSGPVNGSLPLSLLRLLVCKAPFAARHLHEGLAACYGMLGLSIIRTLTLIGMHGLGITPPLTLTLAPTLTYPYRYPYPYCSYYILLCRFVRTWESQALVDTLEINQCWGT